MITANIPTLDFYQCYAERWGGLLCPEAMAHPAKFSPGLITRIYDHGFARGWWRPVDLVADCFGGVGCGGVLAPYKGLRWLGVELEERFVALARRNFELHRRRWEAGGDPVPVIVRGDSRRFAEAVRDAAGLVTSPPYADIAPRNDAEKIAAAKAGGKTAARARWGYNRGSAGQQDYGATPGQIGALAAGDVDAVVTSPPWENQEPSHAQGDPRRFGTGGQTYKGAVYGTATGQIGRDVGETYWDAVAQVYAQCLLALKPGGVACIVVKGYVRRGQLVDLPGQTLRLLLSLGFEPVERIRAWLVEERREAGLFGEVVTTKSRASFFRRLATKRGAPPIDFEEILVVRKPPTPEAP
jgi:SAM-dependent methyltransferase